MPRYCKFSECNIKTVEAGACQTIGCDDPYKAAGADNPPCKEGELDFQGSVVLQGGDPVTGECFGVGTQEIVSFAAAITCTDNRYEQPTPDGGFGKLELPFNIHVGLQAKAQAPPPDCIGPSACIGGSGGAGTGTDSGSGMSGD